MKIVVRDPRTQIKLTIPGKLIVARGKVEIEFVPVVALSISNARDRQLMVVLSEQSRARTARVLSALTVRIGTMRVRKATLIASSQKSFGSLVPTAHQLREAKEDGELAVVITSAKAEQSFISSTFPCHLLVQPLTKRRRGDDDTNDEEGDWCSKLPCHPHWVWKNWRNRWTWCHGRCPPNLNCKCGKKPGARVCRNGWFLCTCM